MEYVSMREAQERLDDLVARAEAGEEIIVRRGATPVAKIVAYHPAKRPRTPGRLRGRISMAADFDAPVDGFADYT